MPLHKASKPPPPQSPGAADAEFRRRARKIGDAIKKDAEGRVCGDCVHAVLSSGGTGACMALVNIQGQSLTIVSAQAVACTVSYLRARS